MVETLKLLHIRDRIVLFVVTDGHASNLAEEILQSENINFPWPVTKIIGGYLTGHCDFFSSKTSAEMQRPVLMEWQGDGSVEHKGDASSHKRKAEEHQEESLRVAKKR